MSETPEDRAEHDVIPEHESPVRRIMTDARGGTYLPLKSLAEAQLCPDGVAIFEGDYGGIIYLTCPVRLIRCSSDTLNRLLVDLDALDFAYPPSAKVYYEQAKPETGIWGGTGGGMVVDGLWIHPRFQVLKLDADIRAIFRGERTTLPYSTEQLLKRAKEGEPAVAAWPRRLAGLYQSWARSASRPERAAYAAKSLAEHEAALRLSKASFGRWLGDVAEMALEAGEDSKAQEYAQRVTRDAWHAIATANYWSSHGEEIHRANIILGTIALRAGDVEKAKQHLIEAAKSPWTIGRYSSQPDMGLAQALLNQGERNAVVEYLKLCQFIWKDRREALLEMMETVRRGGGLESG